MKKIEKKMTEARQKTVWFQVVYAKDIDTIQRMLKEGFDVNARDRYGWTALNWSCYYGNIDAVKILLDNGSDVNTEDEDEITPLHIACFYGHIDIAKLLIENGANINTKDKNGNTPWDELKKRHPQKHEELIEWLTEHHPEKMLEYMAKENSPSKGVGL